MRKNYAKGKENTAGARREVPAALSLEPDKRIFRQPGGSRFTADGYANPAAFLGERSPLFSAGTFVRRNLTANPEYLTTLYRESWLVKRIIDMPSEDVTRAWYRLSGSVDEAELHALRGLEARHSVKQELTNALRWARLYGGSLALMVIRGEEDRTEQPLDTQRLLPGCFQGLLVLDRTQGIRPSLDLVKDLDDPDFGLPESYTVDPGGESGRPFTLHHSRVLRFVGRELPRLETVRESYWGASEMEHIHEELVKRNTASANIAELLFQANITTLKMSDYGDLLGAGTEKQKADVQKAMEMENRFRTSFGIQLLSKDDTMETHSYSFTGLSEIYEQFMMDMAGAAEIPATRLFGRSPQGMNATGESDLRNYYDMISSLQERQLRPALEKLLPVMAASCWCCVPDDLEFVFEPVMTASPSERAELVQKLSWDVLEAYKCGLFTKEQAVAELKSRGEGLGVYIQV